jgi:hypothetical protein
MCRRSSCSPEVPLSFSTSAMSSPPEAMGEIPLWVTQTASPIFLTALDHLPGRAIRRSSALHGAHQHSTICRYSVARFHLPRDGRTPDDLHRPVPMRSVEHSPFGTSCPRVGIRVTRPHCCLFSGFSLCDSVWRVALSRIGGAFDRKARHRSR